MRYRLALSLPLFFVFACSPVETNNPDVVQEPEDLLSGVYNVEAVTCDGAPEDISVTATVTFDEGSYLEEWDFANTECELSLSGTTVSDEAELTIEDVNVTCEGECPPPICNTPCPVDQVYQYSRDGNELVLSFTQQGDEVACGPCGDGVSSTYTLVELP